MHLPLADTTEIPTLVAAMIPHALRHGAIHGALGTREPGQAMILVAPHNPTPLLREIEARDEEYTVEYLQEGPDDWHLKFTRVS